MLGIQASQWLHCLGGHRVWGESVCLLQREATVQDALGPPLSPVQCIVCPHAEHVRCAEVGAGIHVMTWHGTWHVAAAGVGLLVQRSGVVRMVSMFR